MKSKRRTAVDKMGNLGRLIYRTGIHEVFEREEDKLFDSNAAESELGGYSLSMYDTYSGIPTWLQKELFKSTLSPMRKRLENASAKIYVVVDGDSLIASAWTQSMTPFLSRYGMEFENAIMLGPDWTHPNFRGKGLHPFLIRKRIESADAGTRLLAVVEGGYKDSIKGFVKNGFVLKKRCRVSTLVSLWHLSKELDMDR